MPVAGPNRPVRVNACLSFSSFLAGPRQSCLAEFFQVEVSVAGRGVQRSVAQHIGNQLQAGTAAMSPCGPSVAQNMRAGGINPGASESPPNNPPHTAQLQRFAHWRPMADKQSPAVG